MGAFKWLSTNGQTHPLAHTHTHTHTHEHTHTRTHNKRWAARERAGGRITCFDWKMLLLIMMRCNLPGPIEDVSAQSAHTHTHTYTPTHTLFLLYFLVLSVPVQSAAGECGFYANERRVEGLQEMREHAGINLHFMITHNQSDVWPRSSSSSSSPFLFSAPPSPPVSSPPWLPLVFSAYFLKNNEKWVWTERRTLTIVLPASTPFTIFPFFSFLF